MYEEGDPFFLYREFIAHFSSLGPTTPTVGPAQKDRVGPAPGEDAAVSDPTQYSLNGGRTVLRLFSRPARKDLVKRVDIPPFSSSGQRARQVAANQEFLCEANPDESLSTPPTLPSVTHACHPASVVVGTMSSAYNNDLFGPLVAAAPVLPTALLFPQPSLANLLSYGEDTSSHASVNECFQILRPTIELLLRSNRVLPNGARSVTVDSDVTSDVRLDCGKATMAMARL
ncbi:hypothetical protein DFH11DRAFT_1729348 [Phellopilus nigrolimitatus]|nr:hypothetical protein DFH11DRAFT_1729348 [Phellopilus nigrolimitatus]